MHADSEDECGTQMLRIVDSLDRYCGLHLKIPDASSLGRSCLDEQDRFVAIFAGTYYFCRHILFLQTHIIRPRRSLGLLKTRVCLLLATTVKLSCAGVFARDSCPSRIPRCSFPLSNTRPNILSHVRCQTSTAMLQTWIDCHVRP